LLTRIKKYSSLSSSARCSLIFAAVYFTACFCYIFLRIQPSLIYQCQIPVFQWQKTFFTDFLSFPGGLAEYASNFLSQFYYYPLLGSLIITACLALICALTLLIQRTVSPDSKIGVLALLPVLLSLMLFSQYEHRLSSTLGLIAALVFFVIYLRLRFKNPAMRLFLFLTLSALIYYLSAGWLLLFSLLSIFYEIIYCRSYILGLLFFFFTLFLPYAAQTYLFLLTLKSAFFYQLIPAYDYRPAVAPYLLVGCFPLFMVAAKIKATGFTARLSEIFNKKAAAAALLLLTMAGALVSYDSAMNTVLKVDRFADSREWEQLLRFVKKHPSGDVLVAFQTNRALLHTNRLSSEMFLYNQQWGADGLYLPTEARKFFSGETSDFYLDLGLLNEAQHWILEDHSNFENSPRHLQRLAVIGILKGEKDLATMALNALDKTILYRSWAKRYRGYLENPALLAADSNMQSILSRKVKHDFIIAPVFPGQDVEGVWRQDHLNRIAFDYMMADYLLTFRLEEFMAALQGSNDLNARRLPRHYQEAILVYAQSARKNPDPFIKKIDLQTRMEFNDFMRILELKKGNALAAQKELKEKYRHTYWYYSLFYNPTMRAARDN
jgi:hypothetical protein